MTTEDDTGRRRWLLLRELFELTLEQPVKDREAFVERICAERGVDPSLREELREMLEADRTEGVDPGKLGSMAPDLLLDLDIKTLAEERIAMGGRRLGNWTLVEPIGQGGMGAVWRAERRDGDFHQQGALKLIRQGFDNLEVRQRFRSERRILAGLQHPNIAAMLDGGESETGQPWLVMEYVQGRTLLSHCDSEKLAVRQRLEIFLAVCEAVSFAHRSLVVHRDLKPSNILIDQDGRVKLLDFGIAKLLEPGQETTGTGQRLFTPEYAAPEQVRGEPVTTSVDVHALGLLLYSMLTGRRPWGKSGSTPAAYEHAVLRQEATRPSQALIQDPAADQCSSERGGLTPARLSAQLRGDLDAIVMKALRKEPVQRYASVAELADDVRRHLLAEPVLARRGNWRYRCRRFLRRHALASTLATAALLSLFGGLGAALWQADRAAAARDLAEAQARRAEAVASFMTEAFRLADPGRANAADPSARDLLERGTEDLETRQDLDASTRAALLLAIGSAWLGLSDIERALPLFEQARVQAETAADPRLVAEAMAALGTAHLNAKEPELALQWLRRARTTLAGAQSIDAAMRRDIDMKTAAALNNQRLFDEALAILEPAWKRERADYGANSAEALGMVNLLVFVLGGAGQAERAQELSAESYLAARGDERLPIQLRRHLLSSHAFSLLGRGEAVQAEEIYREVLALTEELYSEGHVSTYYALSNVATALSQQGRLAEAIEVRERVLEICQSQLPAEDRRILEARVRLAWEQLKVRDYIAARELMTDTVGAWTEETRMGSDHYRALFQLALAHEQLSELTDAIKHLQAAEAGHLSGALTGTIWWQAEMSILSWRLALRDPAQLPDCAVGVQLLQAPKLVPEPRAEILLLKAHCLQRQGRAEAARERLAEMAALEPKRLSEYALAILPVLRRELLSEVVTEIVE